MIGEIIIYINLYTNECKHLLSIFLINLMSTGRHMELDKQTYEALLPLWENNEPVNDNLIETTAKEIAEREGIKCGVSKQWIRRFKRDIKRDNSDMIEKLKLSSNLMRIKNRKQRQLEKNEVNDDCNESLPENLNNSDYSCPICQKQYTTREFLRDHCRSKHHNVRLCVACGLERGIRMNSKVIMRHKNNGEKESKQEEDIQEALNKVQDDSFHFDGIKYECFMCPSNPVFFSKPTIQTHIIKEHADRLIDMGDVYIVK